MSDDAPRRSWLREPLVHFVVLGAALFVVHRAVAPPSPPQPAEERAIVVDEDLAGALAARHERRLGRAPTEPEREALLAQFHRDEALYREARRLGLASGDEIVRRRLVQKMEFLLRGTLAIPEPTEEELRAWLAEHGEELERPARVAFEHAFFSRDRRGEEASADAAAALAALPSPEAEPGPAGDPFLLGHDQPLATERRIGERFGPAFAAAVMEAPEGRWSGPHRSSYGAHLVRVTAREPARAPTLAEVRDEVRRRMVDAREEEAYEEALDALVASYPLREPGS